MDIRIKFLGAAQTVTGSKYLLEIDDYKVLIDCGLFQGLKDLRLRNWDTFPIEASEIDDVILTHAHIDHTGYLPKLFKEGFRGDVFCTSPTAELIEIMLLDSAKLQEEEAAYAARKGYSKHKNPEPLYTTEDAEAVFPYVRPCEMNKKIIIHNRIEVCFRPAGHILGAASIEIYARNRVDKKKIVFSGDIGRYDNPVLPDPATLEDADILLVESTYGNKGNPIDDPEKELQKIINQAFDNRGCVLIPAFSVGRTQTILYHLTQLIDRKEIPSVPIYVDSPMAINVTDLYKKYFKYHKLKQVWNRSVFEHPNIKYVRDQKDSVKINDIKKNAIILSASGMCTGGRILHHLYNRLPRENDTLIFVGFQPEGTRGRDILDQEKMVKIFGLWVDVKCNISYIKGLSAHADRDELMRWLSSFKESPKRTFIVHGELDSARAFANTISEQLGWHNVKIPEYLEAVSLYKGL